MKSWNKILGVLMVAVGCIAMLGAVIQASGAGNVFALVRGNSSYTCNDIVFSETVNNPSAYADISDLRTKNVTTINCSMTNLSNANYASTLTNSAIKIGGSKSGKYAGSIDFKLKEQTTDKLIIYATGWSGDTADLKLKVNSSDYQTVSQTDSSYSFTAYTFNLASATDSITLYNNQEASGKSRLVISKIVFRLYGESSGGDPSTSEIPSTSGSTPTTSVPTTSTPAETVITLLPDNSCASAAECSMTDQGITIHISNGIINTTQFRVYKGKTITISSSDYIKKIEFTCTAEGSAQYGPGCFSCTSGTYDYSGVIGTWTGELKSITFTASLNQVRLTQIVITL